MYVVSEARGKNSCTMYSNDKLFDASFRFSINCISYFVVVIMGAEVDGVSEARVTISLPIIFDENLALFYPLRGAVILVLN